MNPFAQNITLSADVDQFQLVVQATGTYSETAANTAGADGSQLRIANTDGLNGDVIGGVLVGPQKVIAGGAIDAGGLLIPAASGRVTELAAETGVVIVGKALEAAASAGDIIFAYVDLVDPRLIPSP